MDQVLTVAKAVEDHLDEEIHKLDRLDDDDLEQLRERRLQHLKSIAAQKQKWMASGHGQYREIPSEKEFFAEVKTSKRVVCHFFRENWPCKVVDKHLTVLATRHLETKFVKLNAEKSPFLADRLKIKVLPTIAIVLNAKVEDYIVGFDELGGTDEFSTEVLEWRLEKAGVIQAEGEASRLTSKPKATRKSVTAGAADSSDSEDD